MVRLKSGAYLQQFPKCEEADVICMDPPPFKLQAEVVQQLFGPPLPASIAVASTSHYGIPRASQDALHLIHLLWDGTVIVMPRYHRVEVGEDARGELAFPAYPDEVWWLPCGTNAMKTEMAFRSPRNRFAEPTDEFDEKPLASHADFFIAGRSSIRPRYGIRISDLTRFLEERRPSGADAFACRNE
ncbi:hypothetical protein [Povalibacter sp.]|uniref:hypothetical protein n=1 Tax=Povalibacter sp. TaxID=1962978 RepID=UPI002F42BF6F